MALSVRLITRQQVVALSVEPATVLQEIEEKQSLQQELSAAIRLGGRHILELFKVSLDCFESLLKPLEELASKRLLVKSRGPCLEPTGGVRRIIRPTKR